MLPEGVFDALVEFREALLHRVAVLQQAVQAPDGVHVELGFQGERQPSQLGAHMVGQLGQDLFRRVALDESVEDFAPVVPEDVREHSPETQPFAVDGLVDALPQARPVSDKLPAVAAQPAQFRELPVRHEAGLGEAELADAGQPQAVSSVILPLSWRTCCAWTRRARMPASSRARQGCSQ